MDLPNGGDLLVELRIDELALSVLAPGSLFLYFSKNGSLAERADDSGVSGVFGKSADGGGGRPADTNLGSERKLRGGDGEREMKLLLLSCCRGEWGLVDWDGDEPELGESGGVAIMIDGRVSPGHSI
jgi:hypothetical protein